MYPIAPHWLNYIDGEWCDSTQHLTVNNPGTAEPLASIAQASVADAERALQAARRCADGGELSRVRPAQRVSWLLRIAEAIAKVKGQVRITGHSDNQPIATLRFPSNWALSRARAEEVLQMLAARTGQAQRFSAEGLSDTEPLASNATAEGRAKNRRVEITVLAEGVE